MHPNRIFRAESRERNLDFARARGFGTLAINGDAEPLTSHVPFLLSADGSKADLHLMRSNPMARRTTSRLPSVITVLGPDSYVSPDWYRVDDQVPTWNYIAVKLTGTLEPLGDDDLPGLLDRLSRHFETMLAPKPPWVADKMSPGAIDPMLRSIQPFRMEVTNVDGTWKLNQNKDNEVRQSSAEHVGQYGLGSEVEALAAHMRHA